LLTKLTIMSKLVRLDDDTYTLLNELKYILRKRSMDAALREVLDNVMQEEEDPGTYQADFEGFDDYE